MQKNTYLIFSVVNQQGKKDNSIIAMFPATKWAGQDLE